MKTNISFKLNPCQSVRIRNWQSETETTKRPSFPGWVLLIVMMLLLVVPLAAYSKGPPPGKGGGKNTEADVIVDVGYRDVFGDLIHIYRDEVTGVPIFAQRWVELPAVVPGYGWGYCAIALTEDNTKIPFLPYSCDLDPGYTAVAVDYFGRLNGSRTREVNLRMHFNEVISNINQAVGLDLGPVGRLMLIDCEVWGTDDVGDPACTTYSPWSTIDSPMESLGLYTRLMRYGHLATDPAEVDDWWHGDIKILVDENGDPVDPVHPALSYADFLEFEAVGLGHLLPESSGVCWSGVDNDVFNVDLCAGPQSLTAADFNSSAIFLGAAASKTRSITVDLVQYVNRFLRISLETQTPEYEPAEFLPAMYFDCYDGTPTDPVETDLNPVDPVYDEYEFCDRVEVDDSTPNHTLYANIQERFMNFGASGFERTTTLNTQTAPLIMQFDVFGVYLEGAFSAPQTVDLLDWINVPNELQGWYPTVTNYDYDVDIVNFVIGANDAVRTVEFIHNYELPVDLYCKYDPLGLLFDHCQTSD